MSRPLISRRALGAGVAIGLGAVALQQYSSRQPVVLPPRPSPAAAGQRIQAAMSTSTAPPAVRAVNLRDIGEVDSRLKRGVLFRCSQIYSPDVLRELKIRTVVDLRGRAERKKKSHGPPALLTPDEVDALNARQGQQPTPGTTAAAAGVSSAGGATVPSALAAQAELEAGGFGVTTLKRASLSSESSVDEEPIGGPPLAALSGGNGNSGNGEQVVVKARGHDQLAAGLGDDLEEPDKEVFNVIPGKEFGYAMLRMPWRIWRGALGNLVTGKDPRRPFVEAFADEQLLGFTRYYIIILEHAKKNIAGVMRVFAKPGALPALVHCAHGKDRTGVIIMLLLLLCDVPHEAIVQDYVQSEIELRRYREELGLPDPTGATGAVIPLTEVIIASTAETLRALLAYMDANYISVDNYLASCGLTQQEIEAIRKNLLQMPPPAGAPAGATAAT